MTTSADLPNSFESSKLKALLRGVLAWFGLFGVLFSSVSSAQEPLVDWQKRQVADDRLTVFGDGLMGDSIDPHIGSITFEHTDVSLPGNSGLKVAIGRRLTQGYKYDEGVNVGFGDWELSTPRISVVASETEKWAGNRCNDSWAINFPAISASQLTGNISLSNPFGGGVITRSIEARSYSDGVTMTVPGYGSQQVLKSPSAQFPSAKATTAGEWYFTCTMASDGKEGFIGHAPNGNKYFFQKAIERPYKKMGFAKKGGVKLQRVKIILAATKVTDINGNYVDYTYDSLGRLTQILANDGRKITLGYSGQLITSATANGRTWNYTYRQTTWDKDDWDVNIAGLLNNSVLSSVTQPDGQYWSFNLDSMFAESQPQTASPMNNRNFTMSLTHPYGTVGTFSIKDVRHRQAYRYYQTVPLRGPIEMYDPEPAPPMPSFYGAEETISAFGPPDPIQIMSTRAMAVTSKKLSSSSMQDMLWTFAYEQDMSCLGINYPNTCATAATSSDTGDGTGGGGGGGGDLDPDGPNCTGFGCIGNYYWSSFDNIDLDLRKNSLNKSIRKMTFKKTEHVRFASLRENLFPTSTPKMGTSVSSDQISRDSDINWLPQKTRTEKPVLFAQNYLDPTTYPSYYDPNIVQPSPSDTYWISNNAPYYSDVIYTSSGHSAKNFTNWTKVTQPSGSEITYYHLWTWEQSFGGKLIEKTVSFGGTILKTANTTHVQHSCNGATMVFSGAASKPGHCPTHMAKTMILQDGDTFTTESTYDMNPSSSDYSFGNPISTSSYSNVSTTPRTTVMTYEHNQTKWVLGLPLSLTTNGRLMANYIYDGFGQKISHTKYGADYATFSYNGDGTMAWFKDANLRQTSLSGWKRGTPQDVTRADGVPLHQYVDDNGWLTSTVDGNGNTTNYGRDTMGRLTLFTPPAGRAPTTIGYSFVGNTVQTITNVQSLSKVTYDSMLRPTLVETKDLSTAISSFINTTYDAAGRAVFSSFPSNSSTAVDGTNTTYDGLGRALTATETVSPFAGTSTAYLAGHKTRITDAAGNQTIHTKNGFGELTQIAQPLGVTTDMNLNPWGEMLSLRQWGSSGGFAVDQTHTYAYNSQDQYRLCRHHTSESGDTLMQYDAAGQMISSARGQASGSGCATPSGNAKVTFGYDLIGRSNATTYTDSSTPNITRTHDNNGNVLTVSRSGVNWVYAYDNHNALTSETLGIDGKTYGSTYGYNTAGHMVSRTMPSGRSLTLTSDGLGRSTNIANGSTHYASGMTYHPSGQLSTMTYGNGQSFSQTLNARLQPAHVQSSVNGNIALNMTYTYDVRGKVNNVINAAITGDNRSYGYDALGRLTSSTGSWGSGSYVYDALGNIRSYSEGARVLAMTYDTYNKLTSHTDTVGGTRSLTYDTRGNVTQLGGLFFTYDMSDQPTYISGTANGTYKYDGNLKRVKSVVNGTTIYNIYDAGGTLIHIDNTTNGEATDYIGKVARIVKKNGMDTVTYLHADHLGSANTGTTATGAVLWREQYTPFGRTLTSPLINNDQAGYTGHIKDSATGLNYMQARYYDPLIGRFLSTDPVGFKPNQPFMFGRYTYVNNDPINAWDPDGKQCPMCGAIALGTKKRIDNSSDPAATAAQITREAEVSTIIAGAGIAGGITIYAGAYVGSAYGFQVIATGEFFVGLGLAEVSGVSVGVGASAVYAQRTFGETFSSFGRKLYSQATGTTIRTIDDLANAIKNNNISAADITVETVVRQGQEYILNTRTGEALKRAGVPRNNWNKVDATGNAGAEARLTGQLERNKLKPPEGCPSPCSTGGN